MSFFDFSNFTKQYYVILGNFDESTLINLLITRMQQNDKYLHIRYPEYNPELIKPL